jgi:hypothetical protein
VPCVTQCARRAASLWHAWHTVLTGIHCCTLPGTALLCCNVYNGVPANGTVNVALTGVSIVLTDSWWVFKSHSWTITYFFCLKIKICRTNFACCYVWV